MEVIKGIKPGIFDQILIELKKISNAVDFLATSAQQRGANVPALSAPLQANSSQIEKCVQINREINREIQEEQGEEK